MNTGLFIDCKMRQLNSRSKLKWLRTIGQEEEAKINQIQGKRIRLKRLVKLFKDNDEEYLSANRIIFVSRDGKELYRIFSMGNLRTSSNM
jgi:hypothetical protein